MKKIKLTHNQFALVDNEDYDFLSQFNWHINKLGYAASQKDNKKYYMHRLVNKTPIGMDTDHINRDRLDNRKVNLRTATRTENAINRGKNKNNTSGFKGVSWNKGNNKWLAHIKVNYKLINLGTFRDIKDAVLVRQNAERIYHV